ncbi:MAG: hypothetical protein RIE08_04915 [Acidimicrobiales bacterium]
MPKTGPQEFCVAGQSPRMRRTIAEVSPVQDQAFGVMAGDHTLEG